MNYVHAVLVPMESRAPLLLLSLFIMTLFPTRESVAAIAQPVVSAGDSFSMALRSDGIAWSWGYNFDGQLGDNSGTDQRSPVRVAVISNIVSIAAGYRHAVALRSDGTVWSWGNNTFAEIGDGGTDPVRFAPVRVSALSNITAISCGQHHSLALETNGNVWAWGWNAYGQLGDGTITNRSVPVRALLPAGVVAVAAGGFHSMALLTNGNVLAWGDNSVGELGDGTSTTSYLPVTASIANVTAIAAGFSHSLALKSDSTISAWGQNIYSALGDGTTENRASPVPVLGMTNVVKIACGGDHSIALKNDATVWTWGRNVYGQLGDNTTTSRPTAAQVTTLNGVSAIAGGYRHTLALKTNGVVYSWGANGRGQLGDGTVSFSRLVPGPVNTINLGTNLLITTDSQLPVASVGANYSVQIAALGGTTPVQWTIANGNLPDGLTLTSSSGLISGVPLNEGSARFVVRVTDNNAQFVEQAFSLKIQSGIPVITSSNTLPAAVATFGYFARLDALFGAKPYSWSVVSGALPPGINLDPALGVISGVPTNLGNASFQIRVTTQNGQFAEKLFALAVVDEPVNTSPWPTAQHDNQRGGRSASRGPLQPLVKWTRQVDGMPGSPTIAQDGTIYLPTGMLNRDSIGYLYSFNNDGSHWQPTARSTFISMAPRAIKSRGSVSKRRPRTHQLDGFSTSTILPGVSPRIRHPRLRLLLMEPFTSVPWTRAYTR
jgi:alpha-tubulin suppressor-like RCC1 family protein